MAGFARRMLPLVLLSSGCCTPAKAPLPFESLPDRAAPAAACIEVEPPVELDVEPVDAWVRAVPRESRYDARGRLVYAVDQPDYASRRRSFFSYDARDRLVHVHREIDRVQIPDGMVRPFCPHGPCPQPEVFRERVEEHLHYDAHDRLDRAVETVTSYDVVTATWRDVAPVPPPGPRVLTICDIDAGACPPARELIDGRFRVSSVRTREMQDDRIPRGEVGHAPCRSLTTSPWVTPVFASARSASAP